MDIFVSKLKSKLQDLIYYLLAGVSGIARINKRIMIHPFRFLAPLLLCIHNEYIIKGVGGFININVSGWQAAMQMTAIQLYCVSSYHSYCALYQQVICSSLDVNTMISNIAFTVWFNIPNLTCKDPCRWIYYYMTWCKSVNIITLMVHSLWVICTSFGWLQEWWALHSECDLVFSRVVIHSTASSNVYSHWLAPCARNSVRLT